MTNAKKEIQTAKQNDRRLVIGIVLGSFLAVLVFNVLTPMMTDDFSYGAEVARASGLTDLVAQEVHQYFHWNGRSVVHFLLRCTLAMPPVLFRIANSLVFAGLSICLYLLLSRRKTWDPLAMLLVQLGLWFFAVDFAETVLWQTGAVNYLWGTAILFAFLTTLFCCEKKSIAEKSAGPCGLAIVGLFLFGLVAGWCNENTSGAVLLAVLFLLWTSRRRIGRFVPAYLAAAAGNLLGLLVMVLAPGNRIRASFLEENHTGLVGLLARFQKISLLLWDRFHWLLVILAAVIMLRLLQNRKALSAAWERERGLWKKARAVFDEEPTLRELKGFVLLFLAASYAMVLTAVTPTRVYFGAGMFLILATVQGMVDALQQERREDETVLARWALYTGVVALLLCFAVMFLRDGTHLYRIRRDMMARVASIEEQKAQGAETVVVEQLNPDYDNPHTVAYRSEPTEDPAYWTNVAYAQYFGVSEIVALPYDSEALP